jgi:hypothetical protein
VELSPCSQFVQTWESPPGKSMTETSRRRAARMAPEDPKEAASVDNEKKPPCGVRVREGHAARASLLPLTQFLRNHARYRLARR